MLLIWITKIKVMTFLPPTLEPIFPSTFGTVVLKQRAPGGSNT